jgi:hypothetical protein
MNFRYVALLAATGLSCAIPASAATMYCCTDANGRKACGDILPPACYGRAYREINEKGTHEVEAPLTPEQRTAREAELKKKKQDEQQATAERLRNRALLDTYGSVDDIDFVRDRTLADLQKGVNQAQEKVNEALKTKQSLDREAEFYKKKSMPDQLSTQILGNTKELQATQESLKLHQKEVDEVRARFEAERKHYIELTGGGSDQRHIAEPSSGAENSAKAR